MVGHVARSHLGILWHVLTICINLGVFNSGPDVLAERCGLLRIGGMESSVAHEVVVEMPSQ